MSFRSNVILVQLICHFGEVPGMILRSLHDIRLGCSLGNLIHLPGQVSLSPVQLRCKPFVFLQRWGRVSRFVIQQEMPFRLNHGQGKQNMLIVISIYMTCQGLTARRCEIGDGAVHSGKAIESWKVHAWSKCIMEVYSRTQLVSRTVLLSVSIFPKSFAFCSSSAAMAIWPSTVFRSCFRSLIRFWKKKMLLVL